MKRVFFASITIFTTLFFAACGDQGAGNKPANAANTANTANAANSNAAANSAAAEADLKKLVTEYAASTAKNDVAAYDKNTSDNFMFVGNDGAVYTKAERLASMKSGETKYDSLTYDDLNVRLNPEGNGAVVIGKATVKGTNMGKPIDASVRVTQVWSKTKDGWKMASLQATNITAKPDDKKAANSNTAASNTAANTAKAPAPANK